MQSYRSNSDCNILTATMKKIRVAIVGDDFDHRPERTLFIRRMIEALIERPEIELTIVHSHAMPDEPLYKKVHEVLIPQLKLPTASRFASFLRYCLTTKDEFDIAHYFKPRLFPFFW